MSGSFSFITCQKRLNTEALRGYPVQKRFPLRLQLQLYARTYNCTYERRRMLTFARTDCKCERTLSRANIHIRLRSHVEVYERTYSSTTARKTPRANVALGYVTIYDST